MPEKITLIGRAGVGKTSILKVLFEGENSKDLMINSPEPTRGIIPKIYSWMDVELSIFDTSGQELSFLLEDENEQMLAFDKAAIVIYILDYPNWINHSQDIINEINKVFKILRLKNIENNLVLIFHKIDLIKQKASINYQLMKNGIKERLNLPKNIPLYLTSISPELDFTSYNAFSEILSSLSWDSNSLKLIVDEKIKYVSESICFITNKENFIIVQSMTHDFDTDLIYKLYILVSYYIKSISTNRDFDNEIHSIDSTNRTLSLIVGNLENLNPNLKKLVLISDNKNKNDIFKLREKIKLEIVNYYNLVDVGIK
ncbi:MAG: GTPase domain-containing protein [Candidatus Lokiarchaeota archaeon]|nr:GTPase domain-containing protein [Candidatus Lokiarchaeota archaeon]